LPAERQLEAIEAGLQGGAVKSVSTFLTDKARLLLMERKEDFARQYHNRTLYETRRSGQAHDVLMFASMVSEG
jgi:hypothetical protein